jgi:hypothetical protein
MSKPVPLVVMDLDPTLKFLRSASMTRAMAESTSLEWKTYDDSTVINALYTVFFWKEKPGFAEVNTATGEKLRTRHAQILDGYVDKWLATLGQGPSPMKQYLDHLAKIRASDHENIDFIFREAREINKMVTDQLRTTIRTLAGVKLAGTIAVAALGGYAAIAIGGATATVAGGVSAAYSVTGAVIKEWNSVPTGQVMAVGKELGKYGAGEYGGQLAEETLKKAGESSALYQKMLEKAERGIAHHSRTVQEAAKQRVRNKAARKLVEKQAQQATAQQGLQQAARTAQIGKGLKVGVPVVFALWDMIEGVSDFNETWEQTK